MPAYLCGEAENVPLRITIANQQVVATRTVDRDETVKSTNTVARRRAAAA
ncbi:MAG TPA: hypothetical protein VFQ95_09565 [Rhodanobacteraceae bacterium]|nr:hypothetical protein [Rhodanobacteraceae bacterium]